MAQFALYNYQFFELPLSEIRDKGQTYGAGAEKVVIVKVGERSVKVRR